MFFKNEEAKITNMNTYQQEQLDALNQIRHYLVSLSRSDMDLLKAEIQPYLIFRRRVNLFLGRHFTGYCTQSCFENRMSACCSKDGIITFWADAVINAFCSDKSQLSDLDDAIRHPHFTHKCVYLGPRGCRWQVRPLVCTMFLCDQAQDKAFDDKPAVKGEWEELKRQAKRYRWPDRVVLFDRIEQLCMAAGYESSLMYLNNSPGLLRVKQKSGLISKPPGMH